MVINILRFPLNALNAICLFLSDKGLMQMRKMCKATKRIVDNLYGTQEPLIRYIDVFELNDERVSITALFKRPMHSLLWKFYVLSAKSELNLKNLAHFRSFVSQGQIDESQECYNSLIRIASIVIELTIRMSEDNAPKLPLYLIHELLNRKCKYLCMISWNCKYSRQEIIKLIQIVHTLDKEISFTGRIERTSDSEMDETIGLYSLAGRGWYTEINPLALLLEWQ
ncbi:hypothetical protein PRIPAC_75988 [Pristionchus pacificus]|uniref:Uncharacterized protein n=1 Tax=Pristionchus pacificus TaxID=54126 RepID=A0A2A6C1C6_PRIPA|nr:hypothetical protein PRIPAC_75988 [Pristionchus pacificus]|eukprot:PDM71975.1 hypothetical protein PRIPAC_38382 [Pristionchus pacificus]